jgi:DNA-binding XRE family transcriptional regulator
MNIGERIKQIRAEKNLTQPQLAEMIGIEQSYLSKLENDKSIPSADIFQSLLKGLDMTATDFLQEIDKDSMYKQLKHIPEVANHLTAQTTIKVHSVKKWLYTSAVLCILGITLFIAGDKELISSNTVHNYESRGITKDQEPIDLLWDRSLIGPYLFKTRTIYLTDEQHDQMAVFEMERLSKNHQVRNQYLGKSFTEQVDGGVRQYIWVGQTEIKKPENRWLMLTGVFLFFSGVFGFITEYRLRKLQV